ncbi:MAG: helix-turn-helix transcriptional regulator [Burkholderiales bacterium]
MSTSADLVDALKAELRRAGITYAQLAAPLGLAESSVKRILAKGDLTLERIDTILGVLRMDFAELARRVVDRRPARPMLGLEQERALVADPRLLTVALCALSEWTFDQIVAAYRLTPAQVVAALAALDRLGLIDLRPNNRYRLRIDKTLRWRPDGPLMRFFRERAMADYFSGGFDGDGELLALVHGQVAPARAQAFVERLQRLVQDFAQQHVADQRLPADERRAFTMLVAQREWWFEDLRAMLREPISGPSAAPQRPARAPARPASSAPPGPAARTAPAARRRR